MGSSLTTFFDQLNHVLSVCPCCEGIFYLSEARPYLKGHRKKSVVDRLRVENRKLDELEQLLDECEEDLRERAAAAGLRSAKSMLKKIDPLFSGAGYDPQDVKVLFNPVTYIVFHGLAKGDVKKVRLLAHAPADRQTEQMHRSIDQTIKRGDYDFHVLRVSATGQISREL